MDSPSPKSKVYLVVLPIDGEPQKNLSDQAEKTSRDKNAKDKKKKKNKKKGLSRNERIDYILGHTVAKM